MRKWIPLIICLLLPIGIIGLLATATPDINKSGNGFRRTWLSNKTEKTSSFVVPPTVNNIAGVQQGWIYFSSKAKGFAVRLNLSNGVTQSIKLLSSINLINKLDASNQLLVRDSSFWIYDFTPALIIKGSLKGDVSSVVKLSEPFTKLVLADSGVVVRKFIPGVRDQALYKVYSSDNMQKKAPKITEDNGDGGLSTDGILLYNEADKSIVYIERSSNNLTVLNEDLNVTKAYRTIDTFSTNRYVATQYQLKHGSIFTNGAPIQYINIAADIDTDFLYIQSGVMSESDNRNSFLKDLVLDIYALKSMKYVGSIVAKGAKEGLRNWAILGKKIVVLKENRLDTYDLQ